MGWSKAIAASFLFTAGLTFPTLGQSIVDRHWPLWGIRFEAMHLVVTADIFDHRSAQYRGMFLVPVEDGNVLCGWLNWRGDSGGYGPYVAFSFTALRGGVREAVVGSLESAGTVPQEVASTGCDPDKLLATQRGHRLP